MGRDLAQIMPRRASANLTNEDTRDHRVSRKPAAGLEERCRPGQFGPTEKPTGFVMKIAPRDAMKK
jgi:hypothetical protein